MSRAVAPSPRHRRAHHFSSLVLDPSAEFFPLRLLKKKERVSVRLLAVCGGIFLGVALELGAELAGEFVVLVAVIPVLLPLVHVLRILLLLAPICA